MQWVIIKVVVKSVTWNVRTMSINSWLDIVDIVCRTENNANKKTQQHLPSEVISHSCCIVFLEKVHMYLGIRTIFGGTADRSLL